MDEDYRMLYDYGTSIEEEHDQEETQKEYDLERIVYSILNYTDIFIAIIGILFNVVIIYIILRNKRLRIRTNIILLNWCIFDVLYLLISELNLLFFMLGLTHVHCTVMASNYVFTLACIILMIIMVTPSLMKRTTIHIAVILATTYTTAFIVFLADIIACSHHIFVGLPITCVVMFVFLFILVAVKNINRCRRKSAIPTSENTLARLNIANIFVCSVTIWIFYQIFIQFILFEYLLPWNMRFGGSYFIVLVSNFIKNLTAFYIWIYLSRTNKEFNCTSLCQRTKPTRSSAPVASAPVNDKYTTRLNSSDVDATISFGGVEDEHVRVNINDST